MKKIMISFTVVLAAALAATLSRPVSASVSGPCGNCHTMHNSQGGNSMVVGGGESKPALLINDCVGCHTGTNIGGTTPYVLSDSGKPTFGENTLAGGNFWWVENVDDAKGHNVFEANPDEALSGGAPGRNIGCGGIGSNSCHKNLHLPYSSGSGLNGKQGCTGCHMISSLNGTKGFHHADDGLPGENTLVNSAEQGWYRFLTGHEMHHGGGHGVSGIEHDKWNYGADASSHNEYLGVPGTGNISTHTMTSYCCGCHANFHDQESGGCWIRHPSDAVIPNKGEYALMSKAYNPLVPVARPSLATVSNTVAPGTDMVMCLSCHVAHGSPYDDLLRWDYALMEAGSSNTGGCFVCHAGKRVEP